VTGKQLHLALKRRIVVECRITPKEDLHVGIGRGEATVTGVDLPIQRDGKERPIIPGSGIRGVFRSHLHRLLSSLKGQAAKNILRGAKVSMSRDDLERWIENPTDMSLPGVIELLFGVTGFASPLRFTDAQLERGGQDPRRVVRRRTHVSIDLGTDRAKRGWLVDLEAVKSSFIFKIIFDELEDPAMTVANIIFYQLIRTLAAGEGVELFLGGWKSRGYGLCTVKACKLTEYTPENLLLASKPNEYEAEGMATFLEGVIATLEGEVGKKEE